MTHRGRVLVLGAPFGGADRAAEAVAEALAAETGGAGTIEVADFYRRFAPRLTQLASLAHRNDAGFVPDGAVTLLDLAASMADAPVVRELASGAVAALETAVGALEPSAIVACDQLAAGVAAELRERHRFACVHVVTALAPARLWSHPGADLLCVAGDEAREAALLHGAVFDRVAVTGVPVRSAYLASARPRGRGAPRVVLFAPDERPQVRAQVAARLTEAGAAVIDASDADPAAPVREAALVVATTGGELLWSVPAAGAGLVLAGESAAAERGSADLLVDLGAAIPVRDLDHAVRTVAHLVRRPARLDALATAAREAGAPTAARVVAKRTLSLIAV